MVLLLLLLLGRLWEIRCDSSWVRDDGESLLSSSALKVVVGMAFGAEGQGKMMGSGRSAAVLDESYKSQE